MPLVGQVCSMRTGYSIISNTAVTSSGFDLYPYHPQIFGCRFCARNNHSINLPVKLPFQMSQSSQHIVNAKQGGTEEQAFIVVQVGDGMLQTVKCMQHQLATLSFLQSGQQHAPDQQHNKERSG